MLFDLRSRGRRRTIQVVYGFLAVLIGGGLVFFGVGGGAGSTGLLSQLANQGTGSSTGIKIDETAVAKADRAVKRDPTSIAAWDGYARAVFTLADTNYVTSGFTPAGAKELAVLDHAWYQYLSLNPAKPDATLAADVAFAFGASGIQEFAVAESGQEVVAENDNSADEYYTLAAYAYFAHEPDRAELAEARALALAPKSERKTITTDLAKVAAEASGSTGSSGATGASG